jgi:hypothetical protein
VEVLLEVSRFCNVSSLSTCGGRTRMSTHPLVPTSAFAAWSVHIRFIIPAVPMEVADSHSGYAQRPYEPSLIAA